MRRRLQLLLVTCLVAIPSSQCGSDIAGSEGYSGEPDRGFGADGTGTVRLKLRQDQRARAAQVQGDGKIVVVGSHVDGARTVILVARFHSDGSLDAEFGQGGLAYAAPEGLSATASGVHVREDGNIVVCASATARNHSALSVAIFRPDGTPDLTYGERGIRVFPREHESFHVSRCDFTADGTMYVSGGSRSALSAEDFGVGMLPPGGNAVLARHDLAARLGDRAEAIDIDDSSRGWLVGNGTFGSSQDILVLRLARDGLSADAPPVRLGGPGNDAAYDIVTTPDRAYLAGHVTSADGFEQFAIFALTSEMKKDEGFGTEGMVTIPFSTGHNRALGIGYHDSKLVVVGESDRSPDQSRFAICRLNRDGSLDPAFAAGGWKTVEVSAGVDSARSVVIQPDGKILVVGESFIDGNYDLMLLRLH